MKDMRSSILSVVVVIAVVAVVPASADDRGFYVGAGMGISSYEASDFYEEFANLRFEDDTFGLKVYGGYRILKYLAVEASYNNFGSVDKHEVSITGVSQSLETEIYAWDASAVGVLPVGKSVDFFGKVGFSSWNADVKVTEDGVVDDLSSSGTDVSFGLGIDFHITKFAIRIEGDWLNISDTGGAFMFSGNLAYFF